MKQYKINWKLYNSNIKSHNFYKMNWNLLNMEGGEVDESRLTKIEESIEDIKKQLYHIVDIQILNEKINSILNKPSKLTDPERENDKLVNRYIKDAKRIRDLKLNRHSMQYKLLDFLKEKKKNIITIKNINLNKIL